MSSEPVQPRLFECRWVPPLRPADCKLVAFDIDSTLIHRECIDEIG